MSAQNNSPSNINLLTCQLRKVDLDDLHVKPAIIRSADQSLSAIRSLPEHQAVMLFTPAIPSNVSFDPFEPLGRAIHSHHRKVRHVPYALEDGFTYVHEAHLADTSVGAVIVVTVGGENADAQSGFADCVLKRSNRSDGRALPAVKIWMGKVSRRGSGGADGWDSAVRCSNFDLEQLEDTAALIFRGSSEERYDGFGL